MNFYTNAFVYGNNILVREIKDGVRNSERMPYKPKLFIKGKNPTHTTLTGVPVSQMEFDSMSEARNFSKEYEDVSNFEIYGNMDFVYPFLAEQYPGAIDYDYSKLKVAIIDIETECESGFPNMDNPVERVNAITIYCDEKYFTFGLNSFNGVLPNHHVKCYDDEARMLMDFLNFWQSLAPDIVTGWNIRFFDIPYLYSRISALMGEKEAKRLSFWNIINQKVVNRKNKDHNVYDLAGIATLDYYELYLTFTYTNQESYRLDSIANIELGEGKLSYSEYESIHEFYKKDFQRFIEYNVHDVTLVKKLEEKLRLMELAVALAYSAKVNLMDIFSQVRTWDAIVFHYLHERGIVVPPKKHNSKDRQYAGAYVKEPKPGLYDWVVSLDLNSLYPHLIMQYNISPETKTEFGKPGSLTPDGIFDREDGKPIKSFIDPIEFFNSVKQRNESVAANGVTFRKDVQGVFPALMEKMYKERKHFKTLMIEAEKKIETCTDAKEKTKLEYDISKYNNFQLVRKIQLNSAYGAIGNEYFRYYDTDLAEAVTLSGQLNIRWIERALNKYLNETLKTTDIDYIIASDTDSIYICLDSLVKKVLKNETDVNKIVDFLDKSVSKLIEPFIEKKYEELAQIMNCGGNYMHMKREVIASKGIWTAKKRYMLNVWDSEGVRYKSVKLKIKGIETTRSSTPQVVREKLKKSIDIIMNGDQEKLIEFISEFKKAFFSLPAEDVAFPRSVNNLKEYHGGTSIYKKSTPIAVKGALIHNHYVRKMKLEKKYKLITDGDKIKFVYLKAPNPICGPEGKDMVITFLNSLPIELDLNNYIDYDTQFEKTFLEPLRNILNVIGWTVEKQNTLEEFFT
jgi:DNA polymerase elongation subunit (family B)